MESSNKSQLMSMDIYILPSGFFKGSLAPHVGKYIQFLTFPGSVSKEAFRLQVVFKHSEGTQKKTPTFHGNAGCFHEKTCCTPQFLGSKLIDLLGRNMSHASCRGNGHTDHLRQEKKHLLLFSILVV